MDPIHPKTHKIFILVTAIILAAAVFVVYLLTQVDLSVRIKSFEQATNNFFVQILHTDSLTPPPLRGVFGEAAKEPLTVDGVFVWTNKNREEVAKIDLVINETLNKVAEKKLQDLFEKQYFEHQSPSGVGPGDLAKLVGYDYIVIGENLALGNFNGDKALVDAWMASPGHRANILNSRYREIGIAVGQGAFEGKTTWIAVQEFGLPITACPQPSQAEKAIIDKSKKVVDTFEDSLSIQKAAIENANPKYGVDYNAKVDKYNVDIHDFNKIVVTLKAKISIYNQAVAKFNKCANIATSTVPTI